MTIEINVRALAIHHAPSAIEEHERIMREQAGPYESYIGTRDAQAKNRA